jgi:DNA (cytosine-5)-methyltransferase 1
LYEGFSPTLRTGRHGLLYAKNGVLRELSGWEALLLQGFPQKLEDKVIGNVANTDLLSQAWNAMSVSVIKAIWEMFLTFISSFTPHGPYSTLIANRKTRISKWIWSYWHAEQLEIW